MPLPAKQTLPRNWPSSITYTPIPVHSPNLSSTELRTLHPPRSTSSLVPALKIPLHSPSYISILPITTPGHPARGQHGLFAAEDLRPGSHIIFYIGFVHGNSDKENHSTSDYDLSLVREAVKLGVDGEQMGNEARFVNDYRGALVQAPNAEFRDVWAEYAHGKETRIERCIAIFVREAGKSGKWKNGIRRGEEILVSYGKGFWGARKEMDEA
ncbi:hypothetical protein P152DRAFT_400438 [Eremomyces bilateralis CBS 781.70]|uniref:SET domain-containing protein n=1 Tax=Eremomyces bilateralis CBS 781.70 TaxID=1392243 RepID=A0A6G1FYQ6_9PEZI|nr:uncharacterized protein P152DRAFT_400438 [Eremomyces bilateralis CBS 781.70]KAF1810852.1 hypothetical protein P152DRAFT_400438 [Eremomyces bilateralis CBS 781.70]